MASSGNFAVFNPLANTQAGLAYSDAVYSQGNTRFRGNTVGTATTQLTHALSSGKWYIEFYIDGTPAGGFPMIGIVASGTDSSTLQNTSNAAAMTITSDLQTVNGTKRVFGSTSSTSYGSGFSNGDICQMAIDIDNGKVWWGKNNTFFASGDPGAGSNAGDTFTGGTEMMVFVGSYSGAAYTIVNAGQDSTFGGNKTAGGNVDSEGFGDFFYSPPSGYLALCSANLPISDDIDPAQTDDDFPQKQFNVVTYTGNGSTQSITGLGFQPDLVWAKSRSALQSHRLADSSRGSAVLFPDTTSAEDTTAGISFDSDGFSWTNSDGSNANDSGKTYVAWCWRANAGSTSSNTDGSITSTVQANTKAGFSIVTYTGNDGAWGSGNRDTFGHGLSAAPEFIIVKERNAIDQWTVFHAHVGNGGGSNAASNNLRLDSNAALYTNQTYKSFGGVMPTSTLVTVEGNTTNSSSSNHVAYIWHSVEGYSKFGSYEGNGNNDGPFIYTGFRPRYWFFKEIDAADDWVAYDTARDTANTGSSKVLRYDSDAAEFDGTSRAVDVLSNGLKIRTSNGTINLSGNTYVFGAWGDVPFKYNNTF